MTDDRFVSYAQNLEDVMLWRALSHGAGPAGFYIDVGAADPAAPSATRAFYDRGWRGLNVQPLPEHADRLREARPRDIVIQAALVARHSASHGEAGHGAAQEHAMSSTDVMWDGATGFSTADAAAAGQHQARGAAVGTIEVPAATLAALCREYVGGPVHFLKVDAGGDEAAVLAGADFAQFRPWIVVIAAIQPPAAVSAVLGWEPALLAAGYGLVWFDGLNRFYLAQEHADLAGHFQAPPNVFDAYIAYDAPLNELLAETIALSHSRGDALEELQAQLANLQRRLDRMQGKPDREDAPTVDGDPAANDTEAEEALADAGPEVPPHTQEPKRPTPLLQPPPPDRTIDLSFARGGFIRRSAMRIYGLVRPVARPLAWRGRTFLVGQVRDDVALLRVRVEQMAAQSASSATTIGDPATIGAMERLLLTLALQDGRNPAPPGLAPLPAGVDASSLSNTVPPR